MQKDTIIKWQCLSFHELDTQQLYAFLRLRTDVFVVEQACPYPELDGKDTLPDTHHLLGDQDGVLIAYARLIAPGSSHDNASFGRVVTAQSARGTGLGHELVKLAVMHCRRLWPEHTIDISAQAYLQDFYAQYGFSAVSDVYLEDGIPHINMHLDTNNG